MATKNRKIIKKKRKIEYIEDFKARNQTPFKRSFEKSNQKFICIFF